MKTIQIDRDVFNFVLSKAAEADEAPAAILRRELGVPPPTETIEVDDDTYNFLLAKAEDLGESASDILRRELGVGGPPPGPAPVPDPAPAPPGAVVFRIPAGTGDGAWNTPERAVLADVGDTLRLVNDDSVPHRLHTPGVPFPHPDADLLPGQAADFVLRAPFDPFLSRPLHDHNAGMDAAFWLAVRPPQ